MNLCQTPKMKQFPNNKKQIKYFKIKNQFKIQPNKNKNLKIYKINKYDI